MSTGTRDDLIDAAQELMLARGYSATGINDICRHAGVSKGAFYHSFESKEALTLEALDAFYRRGLEALLSVDVSDVEPSERFIVFVDRVADYAPTLWERGCLIGGLASETALSSDVLQERVAKHFDRFAEILTSVAEPFVATLNDPETTALGLAEEFLAVVEGSIVLSRGYRDPNRIRVALQRFVHHLRQLPRS